MLHEYVCMFQQGLTKDHWPIQNLKNKIPWKQLIEAYGKDLRILFII